MILDTPGMEPGYHWSHIQPEIAKFTRACWFDRAGIGWSDPGPYPRTSAEIAKDLHTLLNSAGVPAPYVLVGASFGGLNVRVYNGFSRAKWLGWFWLTRRMKTSRSERRDSCLGAATRCRGTGCIRCICYIKEQPVLVSCDYVRLPYSRQKNLPSARVDRSAGRWGNSQKYCDFHQ